MKNIKRTLFSLLIFSNFFLGWSQNIPPTIEAEGSQSYCPTSQLRIVTAFDIIDSNDTDIDAFFIQISSGYSFNSDRLLLIGNHPNIETTWNSSEGKLTLRGVNGSEMLYSDVIAAVKDVVFESDEDTRTGDKFFSFTIGNANFLPSTGHYYEYVSSVGITWTQARAAADSRTYFGLKGYLATITTVDEAQLSGEQASGAGWIGGSDAETEGVWKWVTGPEAGTVFWNGLSNGSTPNYANWNSGEPNQFGNEDYAHITAPGIGRNGSWNDLTNTGANSGDYQPKGYIVEYGGMPGDPEINISASTQINIPSIEGFSVSEAECGPTQITLNATATDGDVVWFTDADSETPIFTGNPFITPPIETTTTYYALASVNGCVKGQKQAITARVIEVPVIESSSGSIVCEGGSGTLQAVPTVGTVQWYDTETGGAPLALGTSFTTPMLNTTTTYFVDAINSGCVTPQRTPVVLTVEKVDAPTGETVQNFCDIDDARISDLIVEGVSVSWYDNEVEGVILDSSETLINNATYYASQTINGCESVERFPVGVQIFETVGMLESGASLILETCDSKEDGDDTNGMASFNLTQKEEEILNGSDSVTFSFQYFFDQNQMIEILNPEEFQNTIPFEQTVYVRIENNNYPDCYTTTSLNLKVNPLPDIEDDLVFKNCDEDGIADGFTDFNLNEINEVILASENPNDFYVTYHETMEDANLGTSPLNPASYNNQISSTVFGRVANKMTKCFKVSTVILEVSTTAFPPDFLEEIENCDADETIDGISTFDLSQLSPVFISQFPSGQNLSVHYYGNEPDALLEENEIVSTTNYSNEIPFFQLLYVRVESDDNGACFGIGPHLSLIVNPRPEFEIEQPEPLCLGGTPVELRVVNAQGDYTYEWRNSQGDTLGDSNILNVSSPDIYEALATSDKGCESFAISYQVDVSEVSKISDDDITISDVSDSNTITIDNTNIGVGDYEYAIDDELGSYKEEPIFMNVSLGVHTIFVRDKNGCGTQIIEVFVMGFPKYFTPNNDGINDTWNVIGLEPEYLSTTSIRIYDRYGKFIKQISPGVLGWNGTFNGQYLEASDYWFVANLLDSSGNVKIYKGHFSLVR